MTEEVCDQHGIPVEWVKGVPNWGTVLVSIGFFLLLTMLVSLMLKHCCAKTEATEDEWLRERLINEEIPVAPQTKNVFTL